MTVNRAAFFIVSAGMLISQPVLAQTGANPTPVVHGVSLVPVTASAGNAISLASPRGPLTRPAVPVQEPEVFVNKKSLQLQKSLAALNLLGATQNLLLLKTIQLQPQSNPRIQSPTLPHNAASIPSLSSAAHDLQRAVRTSNTPGAHPPVQMAAHAAAPSFQLHTEISMDGDMQSVVPPDMQVSAGHASVVQVDNATISIWDKTQLTSAAHKSYNIVNSASEGATRNGVFDVPTGFIACDPWITYDATSRRWILSALESNRTTGDSAVLIAVSAPEDPLSWTVRSLGIDKRVLHDQPKLGISDDKIAIGWNDYKFVGLDATGNPIYDYLGGVWSVFDQRALEDNPLAAQGSSSGQPDYCHANPVPARGMGGTTALYILSSVTPDTSCNGAGVSAPSVHTGNDIWIVKVDGVATVATATFDDISVHEYSAPADAVQPNTDKRISAGDTRLLSAVWQHNSLWTVANGSCKLGTQQRGCFRLLRFSTAGPRILNKDDVSVVSSDRDILFPALAVTPQDDVFAAVAEVSSRRYLAAGVFAQLTHHGDWQLLTYQQGKFAATCPIDDDTARIGDYFGADRDPDQPNKIWAVAQVANASKANAQRQDADIDCYQASSIGLFSIRP